MGCGKAYFHARSLRKHERTHTPGHEKENFEMNAPIQGMEFNVPVMSNVPVMPDYNVLGYMYRPEGEMMYAPATWTSAGL